jgi:hypothetical protein
MKINYTMTNQPWSGRWNNDTGVVIIWNTDRPPLGALVFAGCWPRHSGISTSSSLMPPLRSPPLIRLPSPQLFCFLPPWRLASCILIMEVAWSDFHTYATGCGGIRTIELRFGVVLWPVDELWRCGTSAALGVSKIENANLSKPKNFYVIIWIVIIHRHPIQGAICKILDRSYSLRPKLGGFCKMFCIIAPPSTGSCRCWQAHEGFRRPCSYPRVYSLVSEERWDTPINPFSVSQQ